MLGNPRGAVRRITECIEAFEKGKGGVASGGGARSTPKGGTPYCAVGVAAGAFEGRAQTSR